ASSKTTTGLWIAAPPLLRVSKDDSHKRKYEAALEAVRCSEDSVPLPKDTSSVIAPLLSMAKANSWPQFVQTAKCIMIELENGQLKIIPHRKLPRPKGALQSLPEGAISLSEDSAGEEVGAALEEAFSRCR